MIFMNKKLASLSEKTSFVKKAWMFSSCLLLYFWCMTLPLVGKAGAATSHYQKNLLTVLIILVASMVCAVFAGLGKQGFLSSNRKRKYYWFAWVSFETILLLFLLFGAFAV